MAERFKIGHSNKPRSWLRAALQGGETLFQLNSIDLRPHGFVALPLDIDPSATVVAIP